MKKYLALSIFLFCCFSCISQKREIISKSTIKLEGRNTNIRNLLDIEGYYFSSASPDSNCRMFFEDGTCVDFSFKRGLSKNEIQANMNQSIERGRNEDQFKWGWEWGVYRIQNDTIIAQKYFKGSFWEAWDLAEVRYEIVDKTIVPIYYRGLRKVDETYYINNSPWIENAEKLNFASADSLPSPYCWLKEEKWIWRNESDWKDYMQRIKLDKTKK